MSIKELGNYQWEWLNRYGKINLNEWRYEYLDNTNLNWYYVGNWQPTQIESFPSNKDGGYEERKNNLKQNPYFYWPDS
tara:strand:- start:180 stop:413 length:234 start_codon:yes stop_codon:yes gene_type:complete